MIGRPTSLTVQLTEAICEHVRIGVGLKVAAHHEGVAEERAWEWQRKGLQALRRIDQGEDERELTENERLYADFAQSIARARAEFEVNILRRLDTLDAGKEAMNPVTGAMEMVNVIDPKIAAALSKSLTWLLERTRRETYGTQITVKVEEAKIVLLETLDGVCERMGATEVFEAFAAELERRDPAVPGEAAPDPIH